MRSLLKEQLITSRLLIVCTLLLSLPGCLSQMAVKEDPDTATALLPAINEIIAPAEPAAGLCAFESSDDLWDRVRLSYGLVDHDHKGVESYQAWYARHQAYLDRVVERASPYLHLIVEAVKERDMPAEIALLPVVESAFQPFAYSHGRAAGLWQFIPGTGRRFALKQNWWYDGRRDVIQSTRAALDYLEYLHQKFDGDWLLALAAYNSGEGTVSKAIRKNRRKGKAIDFWSLKLPKETRGYVPKLLAISNVIANPEANGVVINQVPNEPFLAVVETDAQIDLDLAAELADVSLEDIYLYNPGFNRWATDPKGPHELLVPVAKAEDFKARLAEYPLNERIKWARHKIKSGENFGTIAQRHRTTISLLKKVNGIRGNTIRAGKMLNIPVARKKLSRYRLSADQRLLAIKERPRNGNKLEHIVQPSDTFWDLAQKYGVRVSQLAKWNGMAPRDPIFPGQKLVIWTNKPAQTSAINPASFKHPHLNDLNRRIAYTVRRGDSLASISQRFRVRVKDVLRWNKKVNGDNYLQPGQRLTLYVDVVRQSGSSSI